jgi:hypothetical protein
LTDKGYDNLQAAFDTISGIERDLAKLLGKRRLVDLRASLREIIASAT